MNISFNPTSPITIPLKLFHRGDPPYAVVHRTGIACSISNVKFDMLFDTGTDYPYIDPKMASMVKLYDSYKISYKPPGYRVCLTIVGLPPLDIDLYVDLDEHKTLLPTRIFTKRYSINFTRNYFSIFKPKETGGFTYKTLYNKVTGAAMPSGTPGFDFLLGDSLETSVFDTGSPISVIDPTTASKIDITRYPQADKLFDIFPGFYIPITLPNVGSIVASTYVLHGKWIKPMNIVSATQFLDNGIEFTLNENSASFSTVAA
jgi:hypothetical protein